MIENIFERVDLGTISMMMLYGVLPESQEKEVSCEQRIKGIYEYFEREMEALSSDEILNQKIQDVFSDCLSKINPIYFELGMQAGARLSQKLFSETV